MRRGGPARAFRFAVALLLAARAAGAPALAADPAASPDPDRSWGPFVEPGFAFFSSVVDARKSEGKGLPRDNLTPRGLVLSLGSGCWAAFDLDLLRMSAIWDGPGLTPAGMAAGSYHAAGRKAPEGEDALPAPAGTVWIGNGIYPGWQTNAVVSLEDPRDAGPDPRQVGRGALPEGLGGFKAIRMKRGRATLEYEVGGIPITEQVSATREEARWVVRRYFAMDRVPHPLWLVVGRPAQTTPDLVTGMRTNIFRAALEAATGESLVPADWVFLTNGILALRVEASSKPVQLLISVTRNETPDGTNAAPFLPRAATVADRRNWADDVTTRGRLGTGGTGDGDAYVVDDVPLPMDNPWRRNVRLADLAFGRDGAAFGVTFDGDVWRIDGLNGDLDRVTWRRFASGLHEPLGIAVRNDEVFVHDRNGLWRLLDGDGNGEADVHERFAGGFAQTAETREYATGLRVLPDGAFVIAQGGQRGSTLGRHSGSVLRVSADGKRVEVLGHGFRQPFIGVHPRTGWVTASDQQGHYTPSTPLHWLEGDRFHGFLPLFLPKERYPESIVDPLTWIPHPINASGAGQVWLADARMGPLNDALIHLGYYRPEVFVVRWHERTGRRQAAVTSLTRDLPFAPLAGAVNPADGQLYVTGFQIWGTVAPRISGLARVRYTGRPDVLPREIVAMDQGVLLRFDVPLEARTATDPANYSLERWNYRRSAEYGSPHYRLDGSKGQDAMSASSAYLSRDGRSVFVGVPDMRPVMQMRMGWTLAAATGQAFSRNAYFTPHELPRFDPGAEGFGEVTVDLTPRARVAEASTPVTVEEGRRLSELMGCVACHSTDGTTLGKVGPTWRGLFGQERPFADGGAARATEEYLRESIREPSKRVIRGYEKTDTGMPSYEGILNDAQVEALVLYLKSL